MNKELSSPIQPNIEIDSPFNIINMESTKHHRAQFSMEENELMIIKSSRVDSKYKSPDNDKITETCSPKKTTDGSVYLLPIVKKAIQLFKKGLLYSQNSIFNEKNALLINDAVYYPKKQSKYDKHIFWTIIYFSKKFLAKLNTLPVFGIYDNFKLFWDLINFVCILFLLFWIPVELGFTQYLPQYWYRIFFYIFILDIFVNMNTSFIENGYVIRDRWRILSKYIPNELPYDFMSCIFFAFGPFSTVHDQSNRFLFFFQWLFFLRIRNFRNIYYRFLERIYSKFNIRDSYIDLLNLIFVSIFIIQIFACIWHFLPYSKMLATRSNVDPSWMKKIGIDEEGWVIRYIYSLYWSSVTIMTVGYGDVTPQTDQEIVFAIVAVCFGCGVTAFIISSIGSVFNEFSAENRAYKQNLYVMNKFMNRKNISSDLQMKVRQYLKFIWQEELTQNAEMESCIIGKLSRTLKDELYTEANGYILNKYPMFFANFSDQMLKVLMYHMKDARFNPGESIFVENEPDECEIYFVVKGEVQITSNSINRFRKYVKKTITTFKTGAVFGEMGFFTGQYRSVSAQSKDFSSLLYISREDFLNTLKKFPQDYERYCKIRDEILLENNYMPLNMKCMACQQYDHLALNCPLLHYNKEHFVRKFAVVPINNTRRFYRRKTKKKLNSLIDLKEIQKKTMFISERIKNNEICFPEHENSSVSLEKSFDNMDDNEIPNELNPNLCVKSPESEPLTPTDRNPEKNENLLKVDSPKKNNKIQFDLPNNQNLMKASGYMMSSSVYPKLFNQNKKLEFEKRHVFNYYYTDHNEKKLLTNFTSLKPFRNDNSIKIKLLNFFIERENPSMEKQQEMLKKYQAFFHLKGSFDIKKARKSYFFGNKTIEEDQPEIKKWTFYDVVYELLTNQNSKKKLTQINERSQRRKKTLSKTMYI